MLPSPRRVYGDHTGQEWPVQNSLHPYKPTWKLTGSDAPWLRPYRIPHNYTRNNYYSQWHIPSEFYTGPDSEIHLTENFTTTAAGSEDTKWKLWIYQLPPPPCYFYALNQYNTSLLGESWLWPYTYNDLSELVHADECVSLWGCSNTWKPIIQRNETMKTH